MLNCGFNSLFWLLVFAIWLLKGQGSVAQEINYKLVPNLQQMKDRSPTPDFTLSDPVGKKISLKDFRGKLVMLNFWATWCDPCREEMPGMERLYQEFKDQGFVILAINVKDRREDALKFIKELKLTYPVVFDPGGDVSVLYRAQTRVSSGRPLSILYEHQATL
jgi:peroxiredoxin